MAEPDVCQRCDRPFAGERFVLRVGVDRAEPRGEGLTVCEDCLRSLERWVAGREARGDGGDGVGGARKGGARRRRVKRSRSPYADELDRGVNDLRRWTYTSLVMIMAGAFGVLGLYAVFLYLLGRRT